MGKLDGPRLRNESTAHWRSTWHTATETHQVTIQDPLLQSSNVNNNPAWKATTVQYQHPL